MPKLKSIAKVVGKIILTAVLAFSPAWLIWAAGYIINQNWLPAGIILGLLMSVAVVWFRNGFKGTSSLETK